MTIKAPIEVALINNAATPYRLHMHSYLVRKMPEIRFWSIFTHEVSNAAWQLSAPLEIRPLFFGPGENSQDSDRFISQWNE